MILQFDSVWSGEPVEEGQDATWSFPRTETRLAIRQEAEAFGRLHPELLVTLPGAFVAVHQGRVVDHDADQMALFLRVEAAYGRQPVLIRQVRPEVEQTVTVYSPRIEHG